MIKEYLPFYIAYNDLKKALKTEFTTAPTPENTKPPRKEWTEDDEQNFVTLLESELDKVFLFQQRKSEEIVERIKASEVEVIRVVSSLDSATDFSQQGSLRSHSHPTDDDFLELELILSDIIADVHDLAKFTQLNYTGFQKIIKKHDVCVPTGVDDYFAHRLIETNQMVPQARLRRSAEGQTFLQGQLRRFCGQALQTVRSCAHQRQSGQG